jgi:hypothetical protein
LIDELYIPVSEVARIEHGGVEYTNVEVDWVRLNRAVPIAPYPTLISDYARLSDTERADAEQYMDELFTGEEYDMLRAYFAERGIILGLGVVPIPMEVIAKSRAVDPNRSPIDSHNGEKSRADPLL